MINVKKNVMNDFKKLKVWQDSIELVTEIYALTRNFPGDERFDITNQIRKCAVSIPSNIAEGAGRNTKGEFRNFLGIASGSVCELESQLNISFNLNYVTEEHCEEILCKLRILHKMIYGLLRSL